MNTYFNFMKEDKLWKWFSIYIRLRDTNENGMCSCFTCGRIAHWREMDCGHGIPRQHKATKYSLLNNHAQCKRCNGFEGGRQADYAKKVDKIYGEGTWDRLVVLSKTTVKYSRFDIEFMTEFYKQLAQDLAKEKRIKI